MSKTITIEIPVTPETTEKVITLPAYRKDNHGDYTKIVSETLMVHVIKGIKTGMLSFSKPDVRFFGREYEECTAEEFDTAYNSVMEKLIQLQLQAA